MKSDSEIAAKRTSFLPAAISWQQWGALFMQTDVWQPVVARICAATAVAPGRHIAAGFPGSCAVFVVDQQVVVKLYPPMLAQDFAREREVYGLLDGRLPYLPQLLGSGLYLDQMDWPYLLLEFRPGLAIREVFDQMTPTNRQQVARELAEMLKVVHGTAVSHVTTFDASAKTWTTFVTQRRAHCLQELRQKQVLPESVLAELAAFLAQVEVGTERPILINADLTEDHLLLIERKGEWHISALIDWADAEIGALEYEWIALWFGLCQRNGAMFRALMQVYDPNWRLNETFLERVLAYTLLHRFGAGVIEHVWQQDGRPTITNLADLRQRLWGNLIPL